MNDPTKPRLGANPPPLPLPPGAPVALCHLSHVGQLDLLGVKRIGLHPEDAKALADQIPKSLEERRAAEGGPPLLLLPPVGWEVVPNAAITRGHVVFDPPARVRTVAPGVGPCSDARGEDLQEARDRMSTLEVGPEVLNALGRHMLTGEPFVEVDVVNRRQNQTTHSLPPSPPEREVVTEWDGDDPIAFRTLTDEEFAEAEKAYEAASARWDQTLGMGVTLGPESWEATAKTATGRVAAFVSTDGVAWRCVEAS